MSVLYTKKTAQVLVDIAVLSLAYLLAFALRFDGIPPLQMVKRLMFTMPYVVGLEFFILTAMGVRRIAWRYVSMRDAQRIGLSVLVFSIPIVALRLVIPWLMPLVPHASYGLVPLGVTFINAAFSFLAIVGVRGLRRAERERSVERKRANSRSEVIVPTLLIGAGAAGAMIAKEIRARPDLGLSAVGFVDDDPVKKGRMIEGITVLGPLADIAQAAHRTEAIQALVTIADLSRGAIKNIVEICRKANLPVKVLPNLGQVLVGEVRMTGVKDVSIVELLGRKPVKLDEALIASSLSGQVVVVSGAGGSIGSEMCRQISRFSPKRLILLERSEHALFQIEQELSEQIAPTEFLPFVCDITDRERVRHIFDEHRPQIVFHAAAHKHVPLMEGNPGEAIKNNVLGTWTLAEASVAFKVARLVLISTDKAVNPTSIMGATKRVSEMILQGFSDPNGTKCMSVRFGNVLGSAGSVIPTFQRQIAAGGPVTVTHPDMCRYFMTIPEASQLVLQAGAMAAGGEIFVLDMGEPVKIVNLAEQLIALSGLEVGEDIQIKFTGMRPGEKLFEELGFEEECMSKTKHDKIWVGTFPSTRKAVFEGDLRHLKTLTECTDRMVVREALAELVPEMIPEHQ